MKTRGTYSRILRNAAAAIAVGVVATVGLSAQSASAVVAPAPNVKACFYYGNGVAASGPVKLYEAPPTSNTATGLRYGNSNSVGCVTFVGVHRGYKYKATFSRTYGNGDIGWEFIQGSTPVGMTGSTGTLVLRGWVSVTCVAGLYGSIC